MMAISDIAAILDKISSIFTIEQNAEITIEANPGTISMDLLQSYRKLGFNRLSLGIQSLDDRDLTFLGRIHSARDNLQAIDFAKEYFTNFNLDFIYCLPDQNLKSWLAQLSKIGKIQSPHLSMYQLTIEPGTPFAKKNFEISDEKQYNFYKETNDYLASCGYEKYEVSNLAKTGFESQHNLSYWNYDDFLGIGPGASGRITLDGEKYEIQELKDVREWMASPLKITPLSQLEREEEALLMGLRTKYGAALDKISHIYKKELGKIQAYISSGDLLIENKHLISTKIGLIKLDAILADLI